MEFFPELDQIEKVTKRLKRQGVPFERNTLAQIEHKGKKYPIQGFVIGSKNPEAPTLGLYGSVHGLEKIGTHVILNYLNSLAFRYSLNLYIRKKFESFRIVSIPMVNPYGVKHNKRGNMNGVDLMRNSPVKAIGKTLPFLSGHRISPRIWWYRGEENKMEQESLALINFVKEQMFSSEFSMALDLHSGFGLRDRLWYPYSKAVGIFPLEHEARNLKRTMKLINPFHIYKIEPQSDSYLIHGDLWDHMFDLHFLDSKYKGFFLPWTLEMGSWNWIKKNPFQIFSQKGWFYPMKLHRVNRVMRRHWWLLDFYTNFIANGGIDLSSSNFK